MVKDRITQLAEKAGVFRYMYNEFDVNADSTSIHKFAELIVKDILGILEAVDNGNFDVGFDEGESDMQIAIQHIVKLYNIKDRC